MKEQYKPIVYLASPLDGTTLQEREWMSKAEKELIGLGFEVIKPRVYGENGAQNIVPFDVVVEEDLHNVEKADLVIAYMFKPSIGTSMEICKAEEYGNTIITIAQNFPVSPWLWYYSDFVVKSLEDAIYIAGLMKEDGVFLK